MNIVQGISYFITNKRLLVTLSLTVFLSSVMANLYQPTKHIDPALFRYGTPLQRSSLAAPTNLQITPNDESMTLSWQNPNDIDNGLYFSLQGSELPSTEFEEIITSQDTTYTDSDLSAMMKLYRVNANYDGVEALVLPDYPTEITFAEDNQIEIPLSQIISNPDDIIEAGINDAQFGTYFDEENRSVFVIPPQDQHGVFDLNLVLNISQVPLTFIINPMTDINFEVVGVLDVLPISTEEPNMTSIVDFYYNQTHQQITTNNDGIGNIQFDRNQLPIYQGKTCLDSIVVKTYSPNGDLKSYETKYGTIALEDSYFHEGENGDMNNLFEIVSLTTANTIQGTPESNLIPTVDVRNDSLVAFEEAAAQNKTLLIDYLELLTGAFPTGIAWENIDLPLNMTEVHGFEIHFYPNISAGYTLERREQVIRTFNAIQDYFVKYDLEFFVHEGEPDTSYMINNGIGIIYNNGSDYASIQTNDGQSWRVIMSIGMERGIRTENNNNLENISDNKNIEDKKYNITNNNQRDPTTYGEPGTWTDVLTINQASTSLIETLTGIFTTNAGPYPQVPTILRESGRTNYISPSDLYLFGLGQNTGHIPTSQMINGFQNKIVTETQDDEIRYKLKLPRTVLYNTFMRILSDE